MISLKRVFLAKQKGGYSEIYFCGVCTPLGICNSSLKKKKRKKNGRCFGSARPRNYFPKSRLIFWVFAVSSLCWAYPEKRSLLPASSVIWPFRALDDSQTDRGTHTSSKSETCNKTQIVFLFSSTRIGLRRCRCHGK